MRTGQGNLSRASTWQHYLRQAREELRLIILVCPFQILQEPNGTPQRIEQVDDRRAVSLCTFGLKLGDKLRTTIILRNMRHEPYLQR